MLVSELTREELYPLIGKLRVWNAKHTQQGTLTEILPEDREDISLVIKWDGGQESQAWHFWCVHLEIVDE